MDAPASNARPHRAITAPIEPVSATAVSVSGKRDLAVREYGPRTAVEIPTAISRDRAPARNAATAALFSAFGEISRFEGVRGGGRSRRRTSLHRGIPCEQGKEQGIFRFSAFLATDLTDYCSNLRSLAVQFPTHQSREFDFVSREFRGRAAKYQNRVSVHRSHTSWSAITSMLRCCPKGWVDRDRTVMFMKGCPA
jgi:hypothetical protein